MLCMYPTYIAALYTDQKLQELRIFLLYAYQILSMTDINKVGTYDNQVQETILLALIATKNQGGASGLKK